MPYSATQPFLEGDLAWSGKRIAAVLPEFFHADGSEDEP
jgi:hypothetical protein